MIATTPDSKGVRQPALLAADNDIARLTRRFQNKKA